MSSVNAAPLWYPPQFPLQGRLPTRPEQVRQNLRVRTKAERDYQDALSVVAGRRVSPPCCKSLQITLCFDGTGNNLNNDLFESGDTPHPTNIARMFRASIGAGHVGGATHRANADRLTDVFGVGNNEYFKYYMPGVGTPFPEVRDMEYSIPGLAFASWGEERVNWALLMLLDALRRALHLPREDNRTLLAAVRAMGTSHGMEWVSGSANRRRQFFTRFSPLLDALRMAMTPNPGQCQLLGLQLYVYGFSRGAAAARAFVNWLNELLVQDGSSLCLKMGGVSLPVSVQYLGILDTVASVGAANILWGADGHMGWGDNNQHVPENGLVKRCLHIVASHEQRLCFPLDSIRREDGSYPANSVEVLHPGVHSDQGGGYPPGDQGKARTVDSRLGDSLLLSQIALNDLYSDAFFHGSPLKVPYEVLPDEMKNQGWRALDVPVSREFSVSSLLVNRFNAWRQVTLGLPPTSLPLPTEQIELYQPLLSDQSIEAALSHQMAWITAWRIDRYAFRSMEKQQFFKDATDNHADPVERSKAKATRDAAQARVERERSEQLARERSGRHAPRPMQPGIKDFDPDTARTQFKEAAEEFAEDYQRGKPRPLEFGGLIVAIMTLYSRAKLQQEYDRLKREGRALVSRLFPPPRNEFNHMSEYQRGNVEEIRNADEPEGLLRALFDEQVHDSRAWFLYWSTPVNVFGVRREPFGSYLRDRIVFFGDTESRMLVIYDQNDQPVAPEHLGLAGNGTAPQPHTPALDAERLAQAQDNIDALFQTHEADDVTV